MGDKNAKGYEWDVFLSYRRIPLIHEWVDETFKELFGRWLAEKLGDDHAKIFFGDDAIRCGDRWPERLTQALRRSKCLVAIWNQSYFQSDWCWREWYSFSERSKKAALGPAGLALPVLWSGGSEHIPEDARTVQWADFRAFARSGLKGTVRHLPFEDKIVDFAEQVARVVALAPDYQDDWPIAEPPAEFKQPRPRKPRF